MFKKYFLIAVTFLCCFSFFSRATAEHGRFAVQSEFHLLSSMDFISIFGEVPSYTPAVELGIRPFFVDRFGMDVMFGLYTNSGYDSDTAQDTDEQPSSFNFSSRLGLVAEIAKGDKANLSLLINFGIILQKQYDYEFGGINMERKFETYVAVAPIAQVGLEPSFDFSEHFSIYSNFGVKMILNPNSQYIDRSDPSYDFNAGVLPLKERNDKSTTFGFYGLAIGMRYYF